MGDFGPEVPWPNSHILKHAGHSEKPKGSIVVTMKPTRNIGEEISGRQTIGRHFRALIVNAFSILIFDNVHLWDISFEKGC